jgi:polar amino acid transport system substrate-binding protein
LDLKPKLVSPPFDKVLPGVVAHRYDLGMASITDTKAREKVVDFIDYFRTGISLYVRGMRGAASP